MDRKAIIFIAAAVAVMLIWQIKFAPKYMPPPAPAVSASPSPGSSPDLASAASSASIAPAQPALVSGSAPITAAMPEENVPEKLQEVTGPAARYEFTNLGGGIATAALLGYPAESGSDVTLNEHGTMPIGAISETQGDGGRDPYRVTVQGQSVLCERTRADGLVITKKFNIPSSTADAAGYRVTMDVTFANHGAKPVQSAGYYVYAGAAAPIHERDMALYTNFDWFRGGKSVPVNISWFEPGKIPLLGIETHPAQPLYTQQADKIGWAAATGQFFSSIVAPENGAAGNGVWAKRFQLPEADNAKVYGIEGALEMPAFNLQPGQTASQTFEIYAGPKVYGVLESLKNGQEKILNFGMFSPVSVVLLRSMNWLHWLLNYNRLIARFLGSYAIVIIIMTLCIRGALWPIQNRATASMRQMQALQPRMTELKAKYESDPARMNQEVMKLYKEYKVNPLAGCVPMVIQLPIFFGFYRMLGTAIELRNSKFFWVHDLSQPDTVAHFLSYPINILPLCMAVTMVWQMSLTPKSGDQSQQRMFMFMPLLFVVFCYNFASALALYYTLSNVFSIVQLYMTRTKTAPAPLKLKPAPLKRRR